jgi:arginine-tRNA-protein transferase
MRIPAALFIPSRSQKRVLKRNCDLSATIVDSVDTDEHYALYERYINLRHHDGDMYPASREQFNRFLTTEWHSTCYFEFRNNGQLLATSVADIMDNAISAIYTYYDPEQEKRSLGNFVILFLIMEAKKRHLDSVYLGYWIKNSKKMNYKSAYRPLEIKTRDGWILVN